MPFQATKNYTPVSIASDDSSVSHQDHESSLATPLIMRHRLQSLAWSHMITHLLVGASAYYVGHFVMKAWLWRRCMDTENGLGQRPPPYSFDENGDLLLRQDLSHELVESTVSGKLIFNFRQLPSSCVHLTILFIRCPHLSYQFVDHMCLDPSDSPHHFGICLGESSTIMGECFQVLGEGQSFAVCPGDGCRGGSSILHDGSWLDGVADQCRQDTGGTSTTQLL